MGGAVMTGGQRPIVELVGKELRLRRSGVQILAGIDIDLRRIWSPLRRSRSCLPTSSTTGRCPPVMTAPSTGRLPCSGSWCRGSVAWPLTPACRRGQP